MNPKTLSMPNVNFKNMSNDNMIKLLVIVLIIMIILGVLFNWLHIMELSDINNNKIIKSYDNHMLKMKEGRIKSFVLTKPKKVTDKINRPYYLRDFYILSSFNSCCGGHYVDDYVGLLPLKNCINYGARVLDFEIFSHIESGEPIIASGLNKYECNSIYVKGSYNHLNFKETMNLVKEWALQGYGSKCLNIDDPLFLSFRIKTKNTWPVYESMANTIQKVFGNYLLSDEYGYNGSSARTPINKMPLNDLKKKVIIICYDDCNSFIESPFEKYINISNKQNSVSKLYLYVNIIDNLNDIISENKEYFSLVYPGGSPGSINYYNNDNNNSLKELVYNGFNGVCMNFSKMDNSLLQILNEFERQSSAFILKQKEYIYEEKYSKEPEEQKVNLNEPSKKRLPTGKTIAIG